MWRPTGPKLVCTLTKLPGGDLFDPKPTWLPHLPQLCKINLLLLSFTKMMKMILVLSALQGRVTGVTGARRHREGKMHPSLNFQGIEGNEEDFGT